MRVLGIIIIILSSLALGYKAFTYEKEDKIVDMGPLKVTTKHDESIPIPPWAGAVGLAVGVALVLIPRK